MNTQIKRSSNYYLQGVLKIPGRDRDRHWHRIATYGAFSVALGLVMLCKTSAAKLVLAAQHHSLTQWFKAYSAILGVAGRVHRYSGVEQRKDGLDGFGLWYATSDRIQQKARAVRLCQVLLNDDRLTRFDSTRLVDLCTALSIRQRHCEGSYRIGTHCEGS